MRKLIRAIGISLALGLGLTLIVWSRDLPAQTLAEAAAHGEAGQSAGEGEAEHPTGTPLNSKADLALWSGVTFVVFLIVLRAFAWGPLISALDKRESRIRDDISEAEAARAKAKQMLAEHAKRLSQVEDEVRAIIAEARRDAEHTKQEIVSAAQKEAESAKQRAINEIGRARDAALKELFDGLAAQVAEATKHVLGRSLTGADQERLIDEALAEFPRA